MPEEIHAIVLFDGVCNLCNGFVRFVIRHDRKKYFLFASLQSASSLTFLSGHETSQAPYKSVLLVENKILYIKSTAALRIARKLDGIYKALYILIIIPPFIRNFLYDYLASRRYKWFGKKDHCMIPSEELKSRFIS